MKPVNVAVGISLLVSAFLAGIAVAPSDPAPVPCPEDAVALGFGDFENGLWERYECTPVDDLARHNTLEVRLVEGEEGLIVRAWLWGFDGLPRWSRDLRQEDPLGTLWDGTDEGQEALDASHWHAEREIAGGGR